MKWPRGLPESRKAQAGKRADYKNCTRTRGDREGWRHLPGRSGNCGAYSGAGGDDNDKRIRFYIPNIWKIKMKEIMLVQLNIIDVIEER